MKLLDNIKKFCEIHQEYADTMLKCESVILSLRKRLCVIPMYFRHFSRHDESHSEKIIQYLEMLFGDDGLAKLSMSDQLFLLLSAYAHDIGMALEHNKIEEFFNDTGFADELRAKVPDGYKDLNDIVKEILEFPDSVKNCKNSDVLRLYSNVSVAIENVFRSGHAKRSKEYVTDDLAINGTLGIRPTKILGEICALHDGAIDGIMSIPFEENGLFGDFLHPRFVAGMLCLGDLLDLDTDRFDEVILRSSSEMPLLSMLHKEKHESITHYLVKNGRIELCADCKSHDVYRVLNEWTGWIKNACEYLTVNWDMISPDTSIVSPRFKQCDITIQGNKKWIKYADSKIHISTEKAVKIFEGTNIYKGKHVFIRELILPT